MEALSWYRYPWPLVLAATSIMCWIFCRTAGPLVERSPATEEPAEASTKTRKCTCSPHGRNLVVCLDGTSLQFGTNYTNVMELYSRLVKDDRQLTYYSSGIGTYATPEWRNTRHYRRKFFNWIDLAIAWTSDRTIREAYQWLAKKYQPGDRIFLFGFSRGGYQARALAGMIHEVGLLYEGNFDQVKFAYQLYAQTKTITNIRDVRKTFKKSFCRDDVCIHYAGLWDCVSSIGIYWTPLPSTMDGMKFVCRIRHALALDEARVKFLPDYIYGGDGPMDDDCQEVDGQQPRVKEVWFPGCHADVGGVSIENQNLDHFSTSLRWISYEAILAGLLLLPPDQPSEPRKPQKFHNSMSYFWSIFECIPLKHRTYSDGPAYVQRCHRGAPRIIRPNQRLHESIFTNPEHLAVKSAILPGATSWQPPPDATSWQSLQTDYEARDTDSWKLGLEKDLDIPPEFYSSS